MCDASGEVSRGREPLRLDQARLQLSQLLVHALEVAGPLRDLELQALGLPVPRARPRDPLRHVP